MCCKPNSFCSIKRWHARARSLIMWLKNSTEREIEVTFSQNA